MGNDALKKSDDKFQTWLKEWKGKISRVMLESADDLNMFTDTAVPSPELGLQAGWAIVSAKGPDPHHCKVLGAGSIPEKLVVNVKVAAIFAALQTALI